MAMPLATLYRDYIACLNAQDWSRLGQFVAETVRYNGKPIGLAGYRQMLVEDHRAIPDLHFTIDLLVSEPPHVACRLVFACTPTGLLFGFPVNGRKVSFAENVIYEFRDGRIVTVWSVIDKAAVGEQLRTPVSP
jgi:predicted ester cyclase